MFTFRRLTILFFILLFALNVMHFVGCRLDWLSGHLCSHAYVYILILFGLYIGISILLAFFIGSGFHHRAICHGETGEKVCAITFDDGPDTEITPKILDVLKREKLSATFFVIGKKLEGNEPLIKRMAEEGHLIGNHSWNHSVWFDFYPARRMKQELEDTAKGISHIVGASPLLFRPPFGVLNPTLSKVLTRLSYHVIGWNVRSYDTVHADRQKTTSRILRKLSPGSIILLHDHLQGSPELLTSLIPEIKRKGFTFVPLTHLIDIKAYA